MLACPVAVPGDALRGPPCAWQNVCWHWRQQREETSSGDRLLLGRRGDGLLSQLDVAALGLGVVDGAVRRDIGVAALHAWPQQAQHCPVSDASTGGCKPASHMDDLGGHSNAGCASSLQGHNFILSMRDEASDAGGTHSATKHQKYQLQTGGRGGLMLRL